MKKIISVGLVLLLLLPVLPVRAGAAGGKVITVDGTIYDLSAGHLPAGMSWNAASSELTLDGFSCGYLDLTQIGASATLILHGTNRLTGFDSAAGKNVTALNAKGVSLSINGTGSLTVDCESTTRVTAITAFLLLVHGGTIDINLSAPSGGKKAELTGIDASIKLYNASSIRVLINNPTGGGSYGIFGDSFVDGSTGVTYVNVRDDGGEAIAVSAETVIQGSGYDLLYSSGDAADSNPKLAVSGMSVTGSYNSHQLVVCPSAAAGLIKTFEASGYLPVRGGIFHGLNDASAVSVISGPVSVKNDSVKWSYIDGGKTKTCSSETPVADGTVYTGSFGFIPTGSAKFYSGAVAVFNGKLVPVSDCSSSDSSFEIRITTLPVTRVHGFTTEIPSVQRDEGIGYEVSPACDVTPQKMNLEYFDQTSAAWRVYSAVSGSSVTVPYDKKFSGNGQRFRFAAYFAENIDVSREFSVLWSKPGVEIGSVGIEAAAPEIGKEFSIPKIVSGTGVRITDWIYTYEGAVVSGKAESGCEYVLTLTLSADEGYLWSDHVSVLINSKKLPDSALKFTAGKIVVSTEFTTPVQIPAFVTQPSGGTVPNGKAFTDVSYSSDYPFEKLVLQRSNGSGWTEVLTVIKNSFDIPYVTSYANQTETFRLAGTYRVSGGTNYVFSKEFRISWYTQTEKIVSVNATVAAPVGGAKPSLTVISSEPDKYSVSSPDWNGTTVFVAGFQYRFRFTVTAAEGYILDVIALNSVRLNGQNCSYVPEASDGKHYVFEYTFVAEYPVVEVKKILVSGVVRPVEGYTAQTTGISLDGTDVSYRVTGMEWLASDGSALGNTPFVFGRKYTLLISLETIHNARFASASGIEITVSDELEFDKSISVLSQSEAKVSIVYTADEDKVIRNISMTLGGVEETRPTSSVEVACDSSKYTVSLTWTSEGGIYPVFIPDVEYIARFVLRPAKGYSLAEPASLSVRVNGETAAFDSVTEDGAVVFVLRMKCRKLPLEFVNQPASAQLGYRENLRVSYSFNKLPTAVTLQTSAEGGWTDLCAAASSYADLLFDENWAGQTILFRVAAKDNDGLFVYSAEFSVSWEAAPIPLAITVQPAGGRAGMNEDFPFSFALSTADALMRLETQDAEGAWQIVFVLDSVNGSIPFAAAYFGKTVLFRVVVWNDLGEYVESEPFSVTWEFIPVFTVQPVGANKRNHEIISVVWAMNTEPDQCILEIFNDGEWSEEKEVTSPLSFSASDSSVIYRIHAQVGEEAVYSDTFTVSFAAPAFTTHPTGGAAKNGKGFAISWKTNFPSQTGFRLQYLSSSGVWIDSSLIESSPFTIPFSTAFTDKTITFRLVGDISYETEFLSTEFTVKWSAAGFVKHPIGGEISNGNDYTIVWSCSENPKSITLEKYSDQQGWVTFARSLTGDTYTISGIEMSNTTQWFRLAAIIGGTTVYSNEFSVKWSGSGSPEFILQPQSGAVLNGKPYSIKWTCNSTMTSFVIYHYELSSSGVGFWNYWGSSGTTTFDIIPTKMMSDTTERFRIKAFYSGGSTFSSEFVVKWSPTKYTMIDSAAISGVSEPIEGKNPVTDPNLVYCGGKFIVTDISWYNAAGTVKYGPYFQFVNGTMYCVKITLAPEAGYEFVPADLMTASCNGRNIEVISVSENDQRNRVIELVLKANPAPKFTKMPAGGSVINGNTLSIKWSFNLTPVSVTLQAFDYSAWLDVYEVSSPFSIPAHADYACTYRLKAVFEDGSILYSDEMNVIWTDPAQMLLNDSYSITGVVEPAAGTHPITDKIAMNSIGCVVNLSDTYWEYQNGNRWIRMDTDDSFSLNAAIKYRLHLVITPHEGFFFGNGAVVSVNGEKVSSMLRYGTDGRELLIPIEYSVATSGGKLNYAYITGLPTIEIGNFIDEITGAADYLSVTTGWIISEIVVYDRTEAAFVTGMFEQDHSYEIRFTLVPRYGYYFNSREVKALVQSNTVMMTELLYNSHNAIRLSYAITLQENITVREIANVDIRVKIPVEEDNPDFAILSGDAEKYAVEVADWLDVEADLSLIDTELFAAGKTYRLILHFVPEIGYVFSSGAVFTVNGLPTESSNLLDPTYRSIEFVAQEKSAPVDTEVTTDPGEESTDPPYMLVFTIQPQSVNLVNGYDYTFNWDVSFTPSKTPILQQYDPETKEWNSYSSLYDKSWDITYREFLRNTSRRYRIRAEYLGTPIYSNTFTVTYSDPCFIVDPVGGIVKNGTDFTISFETNIKTTLIRVERAFGSSDEFSIGRDTIYTNPYTISCGVGTFEDYSDKTVRFRLYAESSEGSFYSGVFTITWTAGDVVPFFTRLPAGGSLPNGDNYSLTWACSFLPNRMHIEGDADGDGVYEKIYADVTTYSFVIPFEPDEAGKNVKFRICADYGNKQIYSGDFIIRWENPETSAPREETDPAVTTDPDHGGERSGSWMWLMFVAVGIAVSVTAATVLMYLVAKRRKV